MRKPDLIAGMQARMDAATNGANGARWKAPPKSQADSVTDSSRWELPPASAYEGDPMPADDGFVGDEPPPPESSDPTPPEPPATISDFRAYMPDHRYIYIPSRDLWPASSVNARIPPIDVGTEKPMMASSWLDQHQACEQMIWAPGQPMIIEDRLISGGGEISRPGARVFNLFIPPNAKLGNSALASLWIEHIRLIYPTDADHIIKWLAHRVQRPGEKINHALVLGGSQGIGKDSILEAVKYAIGPWNMAEVSPTNLLGRFNPFVKSVILRVSEARDLGEVDRYAFYEHMKVYTAAPPDALRCDEKNLREHSVMNVCGVVMTTNHKIDGIYLPPDDRRHYVAWSGMAKEDFDVGYFPNLYRWYAAGGLSHVAAFLAEFDLAGFDAKAPPPKTAAFWEIVDANAAPEDAELADVLDVLRNPPAFTLSDLQHPMANADFKAWLTDPRNRRAIPHRLESVGYIATRNDAAKDGLWVIGRKRQSIYALKSLSTRDRIVAANSLFNDGRANQ